MTTTLSSIVGGQRITGSGQANINPSNLKDVVSEYGHIDAQVATDAIAAAKAAFPPKISNQVAMAMEWHTVFAIVQCKSLNAGDFCYAVSDHLAHLVGVLDQWASCLVGKNHSQVKPQKFPIADSGF